MVKVAVLGFGTVGSGVVEVLDVNSDKITQNAAREITVKYIVDVRDFSDNPYKNYFIKDFSIVEKDPEVQIVIETIGGIGVAYDFTKRSLLAGKSVVTSNKELVATHGVELLKIAEENGVNYLFEASVGGGIPIIRPITQCLAANKIEEIYGILNGTTNYILTEMIKNGLDFDTALSHARQKGYAEADPTSDIEGYDACRKICILASLCFGHHIYPEQVQTEGIRAVTQADVAAAAAGGYKIKLIARAIENDKGKVAAYVAPHLISKDNLLAGVEGVMNGIMVSGNAIGKAMFYGAGAGRLPTASAVAADVIDAAKHIGRRRDIRWEEGGEEFVFSPEEIASRWYVRLEKLPEDDAVIKEYMETLLDPGEGIVIITKQMLKRQLNKLLENSRVISMFRIID